MSSENNTCQSCSLPQSENTVRSLTRSGLTLEEKQAIWKVLNTFYEQGNPFAYQFTANDVNQEVANVVRQMTMDFSDCAKKVAPFEIVSVIISIWSLANAKSWLELALNLGVFDGPGGLTLNACRNTQAAYKKTALYMAFLGI